ncbi:hypothetical protein LTR40_011806, partial [Exophiala xenobiotica]
VLNDPTGLADNTTMAVAGMIVKAPIHRVTKISPSTPGRRSPPSKETNDNRLYEPALISQPQVGRLLSLRP